MHIRAEEPTDFIGVHEVNASAFETEAEANLVEVLRRESQSMVSLVAEDKGEIVGHILFSPVTLTDHLELNIMGLAPMAVKPNHQRKGIGSALVRAGLEICKEMGAGAVIVLGHSTYYPRFGFLPAVRFGIYCEYNVPEDVFMLIELQPGYLQGSGGTIKYHPAFSQV